MSVEASGKVLALFISSEGVSMRSPKLEVLMDEKGIIGDRFYDKDVRRSVLITSVESYALAKKHGIDMPEGSLGENLLIDYNPYTLPAHAKLRVGEVLLQISQNCTICNHLSSIDERLPRLLKEDRGIFAQVLQGGVIKKDDKIYIEKEIAS